MCEHSDRERAVFMGEFGAVRDEIRKDLRDHRLEHREDVRDLYKHIDKKFTAMSEDFATVRDDVTEHKVKLGKISLVGSFFGVIAGGISAWIVTHLTNGGST